MFYGNDGPMNYENFTFTTGVQIQREKFQKIVRGISLKLLGVDTTITAMTAVDFRKMFDIKKKGSKAFRNILSGKITSFQPHNIVKYATTTDVVINDINGQRLNNLWNLSFLDNSTRVFSFKLHNNTLGLNTRVSKFIRGHSHECSFCQITQNGEDNRETPLHFFFQCDSVETIFDDTFEEIFGPRHIEIIHRSSYFGGLNDDNENKNMISMILSIWFKKYLWDCKQKFTLPQTRTAIEYLKDKLNTSFDNSKQFKDLVLNCGVHIRF